MSTTIIIILNCVQIPPDVRGSTAYALVFRPSSRTRTFSSTRYISAVNVDSSVLLRVMELQRFDQLRPRVLEE